MGFPTSKRIRDPRYSVFPVIILFTVLIVTNPGTDLFFSPGNQRTDRLQEDFIPHVLYRKAANTLLVDHDPITIDGNDDFHDQAAIEGWTGEGTANKPYIISYYRIGAVYDSFECIYIRNTDLYFRISNCVLTRGGSQGIYLEKVHNAFIFGNNISNNGNGRGVFLYDCTNITFSSNNVNSNGAEGILIRGSRVITVSDNSITNCFTGIYIDRSHNNSIIGNIVSKNSRREGLFSFAGGINIDGSHNNTVCYNTVSNNAGYGIATINSANNTVYYNNFMTNNDRDVQAFDGELRPLRSSVCPLKRDLQEGDDSPRLAIRRSYRKSNFSYNHWNDWTTPDEDGDGIVDKPYVIDSSFDSNADPYPLVNPVTAAASNSQVHGWTFPVLVVTFIIPVLVRRKNKTEYYST